MTQFQPYNVSTHNDRLDKIKSLSPKQYIDDGSVALYHVLKMSQALGHHATVEFALKELERLYNLNV